MTDTKMLLPIAWVLPGDDTARDDGFIDARIDREGEFTEPVQRERDEAREKLAEVERERADGLYGVDRVAKLVQTYAGIEQRAEQAEARLAQMRALPDRWDAEAADYPVESGEKAVYAAKAVTMCAVELRAALARRGGGRQRAANEGVVMSGNERAYEVVTRIFDVLHGSVYVRVRIASAKHAVAMVRRAARVGAHETWVFIGARYVGQVGGAVQVGQ